ncbi:MAG TPA: AMP-binding protein [Candidatus Sulfotelmatobacter sp.]|jgi:long-chain acyl-CoA synthetase|nr:AMP-binding protein [Candidatus Sulfotelmatobacter sp.]
MAESLEEFFLEHFQTHRRECAYRQRRGYRTESRTYGQVLEMSFGVSRELKTLGIAKGDRVMLWGANSSEWVAAFFGCVLSSVVVVPMDDASAPDFAMRVYQKVSAKLLIASPAHLDERANSAIPTIPTLSLDELPRSPTQSTTPPNLGLRRDDLLQIVFTSGTTADPKGVVITHGNVLANIAPLEREMRAYLKYERFVHPIRFLNLLPLSHVFGQFLGMFLPPLLGGTVIFQEELKPSEVLDAIRRERVSVLVSVPRVLQSLKQKIERDLEDQGERDAFRRRFRSSSGQHFLRRWWTFRSIHRQFGWKFWAFISGGAALDAETEEFWGRLGYAVIQGYGLTETTSLISVNHPFRLGKGSIGKVLPGRELKLAEDGEILVRGGGVASGYWDDDGAQKVFDTQGWYRTGDIGALDDAGNLYFKGRKKEVIVTPGGMNIYPDDLEAALLRQPEVKDCVVVGMERGGNAEPCAVVILRGDAPLGEVVKRANDSLAEYQRMRLWMEWPEEDFPRTNTQKPRRNLIHEVAQTQLFEPAAADHSNRLLAELIARVTGRAVGGLRDNASLDSDLGLSSLDRVELLSALEDRYQVDLSETRFSTVRTAGDLEKMLRGSTSSGAGYHYPNFALRWPVTWLRFLAHYLLMRPAIFLLGWPRIEGRENLRGVSGPVLVISNHVGDVDPGFILTALPTRFRHRLATATGGEALEALRSPGPGRGILGGTYDRVKWALGVSLLNLFPLPREAGFRRSFAYAGEAVDRGYSVLVFPEGRHTTDGKMNPFRAGIGLLAENLGIPVLPMRIDGLFEVKQAGKKFAKPWTIRVRIGKPMKFARDTDPRKIAAELQKAVEAL